MQKIMNQDVVRKIEGFLDNRINVDGRSKSFIDHINSQMAAFVEKINETIKQVDEEYEYKAKKNQKQNIRPSDILENILDAYFVKRTLKVSDKELSELSSGEQRRALIDIIYAFLKNKGIEDEANGRNVILAIDEPEVSQDITHCFEQFERLEKLSNTFGNQVLVTTHWYGILPVIENGTLLHISADGNYKGENRFSVFNFYNYLDQKEHFPDDIQLKSLYDLAISLNTYIKKKNAKHMIICEGGTDKRYIETLVDPSKVKIIPVGGIDNVRNLYQLLVMPLEIENKKSSRKKVLCLTDTDENIWDNSNLLKDRTGDIQLRRLQINYDANEVELVRFDNYQPGQRYSTTRIEDVLHVPTWIESMKEIINKYYEEISYLPYDKYMFISESKFTNLRGTPSIIFTESLEAEAKKMEFIEFLENKKSELSNVYLDKFKKTIESEGIETIPPLFVALNKFFKEDVLYKLIPKGQLDLFDYFHNV